MWTNTEEARSDFILAAAVAVFGPLILRLLNPLLNRLSLSVFSILLNGALVFAVTGLTPVLLARYRDEDTAAFGLDTQPGPGILPGILAGVPILLVALYATLRGGGDLLSGLLGTLTAFSGSPVGIVATVLARAAGFAGLVLLYTFLAVKARHGFARTELNQVEALRTFGIATAGVALLVGLLAAATPDVSLLRAVVDVLALVIMVLVADRFVTTTATTSRATVLAPALVAVLLAVNIFGGGAESLLASVRTGLLAGGFILVTTMFVESRRYAWAVIPMFAFVTVYRTAFFPI